MLGETDGGGTGVAAGAVQLAALLACLDAELPWTSVHHDAVVSLLPVRPLAEGRFDEEQAEPFRYVVEGLLERDTDEAREAAFALVEAGLRHPEADARGEAVWAAEHACQVSRAAAPRLAGALTTLLGDPSSVSAALSVVDQLGPHATRAVPALMAIATEEETWPTARWRHWSRRPRSRLPRCWPQTCRGGRGRSTPRRN